MPKSRPLPVFTEPAPAGNKPGQAPPAFRRQMVELARTGRRLEELAREWLMWMLRRPSFTSAPSGQPASASAIALNPIASTPSPLG